MISDITLLILTSFPNLFQKKFIEISKLGIQDSSRDTMAAGGRFVPGFFLASKAATPVRSREACWLWGRGKND